MFVPAIARTQLTVTIEHFQHQMYENSELYFDASVCSIYIAKAELACSGERENVLW